MVEMTPEQIEKLKHDNETLTNLLNECIQEGLCGGIAATVEKGEGEKPFKKEKSKDGQLHYTYVREDSRGALFDVVCGCDGTMAMYPRGVKLYNGKTTLSSEELQKVHSSCLWAEEIHAMFDDLGMSECGRYEEMPEDQKEALYDPENYYYITQFEESARFLWISYYSLDEIAELLDVSQDKVKKALGIKTLEGSSGEDMEQTVVGSDTVSDAENENAAYIDRK